MYTSAHPHTSEHRLTEENLLNLSVQKRTLPLSGAPSVSSQISSLSPTPSPSQRLRIAERAVFDIAAKLLHLVRDRHYEEHHRCEIHRILKTNGFRSTTSAKRIHYQRNEGETTDFENALYWEGKRTDLEDTHRFYNELRDAKEWVYDTMRALERLGPKGRQALEEEEELYITDQNLVRFRDEQQPKPNVETPTYWKSKLHDLRDRYRDIKRQTVPPPPLVKPEQAKEWVYNILKALEDIGDEENLALKNSDLYIAGENDVRFRDGDAEPDQDDTAYWMAQLQHLGESYVSESRIHKVGPNPHPVTLEQAKKSVFNIMWALKLKPEGRRILEDDDLYIAGWNDVRCRHHQRNLRNSKIWLDRLKYFNDRYHDISRWESRRRNGQILVYNEIQQLVWGQGRSGLRLLLDDELYFDIPTDSIRYRGENGYDARYQGREPPDLDDPAYWEKKLQDFKAKNEHARCKFPSPHNLSPTEIEEIEEIEEAKEAYKLLSIERVHEEGKIESWLDSLRFENLEQPSSSPSVWSGTLESKSNEGKPQLLNGHPEEIHSASKSGNSMPSPSRAQIAPNVSAQQLPHGWETANPILQLAGGLVRKSHHSDMTASHEESCESRQASISARLTSEITTEDQGGKHARHDVHESDIPAPKRLKCEGPHARQSQSQGGRVLTTSTYVRSMGRGMPRNVPFPKEDANRLILKSEAQPVRRSLRIAALEKQLTLASPARNHRQLEKSTTGQHRGKNTHQDISKGRRRRNCRVQKHKSHHAPTGNFRSSGALPREPAFTVRRSARLSQKVSALSSKTQ